MLPLTPSAPPHLAPLFAKTSASRCCWFGRLLLPKVPCFALWSCFPMVPHRLPRSGNLFRTDFRFAPSLPQRFACGLLPFTRDMGVHGLCGRVPDSAGSIICHLAAAPQARRQPYPAQVRQIASQTGVLPRRMRFVAGRGHCSSKSPRARILVLGTSGAHWPARWPRFELTERVAKSQLSGY